MLRATRLSGALLPALSRRSTALTAPAPLLAAAHTRAWPIMQEIRRDLSAILLIIAGGGLMLLGAEHMMGKRVPIPEARYVEHEWIDPKSTYDGERGVVPVDRIAELRRLGVSEEEIEELTENDFVREVMGLKDEFAGQGMTADHKLPKEYQGRGSRVEDALGGVGIPSPKAAIKFFEGGFEDKMSRKEAALILGVRETADKDKILERYRTLMKINHPDMGGSPFLSYKVNEAKDMLSTSDEEGDTKKGGGAGSSAGEAKGKARR